MKMLTQAPALGTNIRRINKHMSAVYTVTNVTEEGRIEITNDEFGCVGFSIDEINARIVKGEMKVLNKVADIIDTFIVTGETGLQAIANVKDGVNKNVYIKYIYPFSDDVPGEGDDMDDIGRLVTVVQAWAEAKGYTMWSY